MFIKKKKKDFVHKFNYFIYIFSQNKKNVEKYYAQFFFIIIIYAW